jgi:predicted TIM-barrel fold metal-dependent hydrolase
VTGSTAVSRTYRVVIPALAILAASGVALFFALRAPAPGPAPSPRAAGERAARVGADLPKIDVHVHVAPNLAAEAVRLLREQGVQVAVNLSGGVPGAGMERSAELVRETGGRLQFMCNLAFGKVHEEGFEGYVRDTLEACKQAGAVGLKVSKALGLGLRNPDGSLLAVDDPRLDVVFETAGRLGLPVLIHTGDPQAFFRPPGPDNERHEELSAHPEWSYHGEQMPGRPWPTWESLWEQLERRVARHPGTTFIGAHFGNAPEEPRRVAALLDRCPNYHLDTAARVPEIGRHPARAMRAFFVKYQDRILFGSDLAVTPDGLTLGSRGARPDPPERLGPFFLAHWRYFETDEARLEHPTPIQGRWTVDGIGLPRLVLEKLYHRNAERLLGLRLPADDRDP